MSYVVSSLQIPPVVSSTQPPLMPVSSSALNLVAALASCELEVYTSGYLGLRRYDSKYVGTGGFATIEIGKTIQKKVVAVKHSRLLARPLPRDEESTFQRHLDQFCLELRILSHESLRRHPNILTVLGLCVDENSGRPSISLVLEYSTYDNLSVFLQAQRCDILLPDQIDLAWQVASGIEALHTLKICHGDVKTQNALVFLEQEGWRVKLSDFGQSVVGFPQNSRLRSGFPSGTPLFNAPEIRTATIHDDEHFTLEDAILTDIFSFGLLLWEILKHGRSFFDMTWFDPNEGIRESDIKAVYLNDLPHNGLYYHAIDFLQELHLEPYNRKRFQTSFRCSLQDTPRQRASMSVIREILEQRNTFVEFENPHIEACEKETTSYEPLVAWTMERSLYEVYQAALQNLVVIEDLPFLIQKQAILELKMLFDSKHVSDVTRAHAAMTLSESYTIGFGVFQDSKEVLHWLLEAALLNNSKAVHWYHRVCTAMGVPAEIKENMKIFGTLEEDLACSPTEKYLAHRIQRLAQIQAHLGRTAINEARSPSKLAFPPDLRYQLALFNSRTTDSLSALHLAAWLGDDEQVTELLVSSAIDLKSTKDFTPVHYACLGGRLSTLRLLLRNNHSVNHKALHGITALHFSIFFEEADVHAAVAELLQHGALKNEEITEIVMWEDHDITLSGTALDWAVLARRKDLVEALLPHSNSLNGLKLAISRFYWEIVEILLPLNRNDDSDLQDLLSYDTVQRPFSHWMAHGLDHKNAVMRTVGVCHKYISLSAVDESGSTELMTVVNSAQTSDDFTLIEAIMALMSSSEIKQLNMEGFSALLFAIQKAKENQVWRTILQALVEHYTVEELEASVMFNESYLHLAVSSDSLVGAQVLLERGVNVNQPTFDEYKSTPLHICMTSLKSPAIYSLLVEYGALTSIKERVTDVTATQARLMGLQKNSQLLDLAMVHDSSTESTGHSLHMILRTTIGSTHSARRDAQEAFTYLLSKSAALKHINDQNANGQTMLQIAAFHLHYRSADLLLEAGADPGIPFKAKSSTLYPLQIACAVGRLFWSKHGIDETSKMLEKRGSALRIASKILQWHHARGHDLFQGITVFHLVSYMSITSEIQRLRNSNHDKNVKGNWPGIAGEVTPAELMDKASDEVLDQLTSFY